MSDVRDRIHGSANRVDNLLNVLGRREIERQAAEDAAAMMAEREQAFADSEKKRVFQSRYDEAFAAFGTRAPAPVEGERAGVYRKRLYEHLRRKLPSDHEWASVRADDIPPSAASQIERLVISAAMAEGLRPSEANLPRDGSLLRRDTVDDMSGQRTINWAGQESFIKGLSRPGQRVVRFFNPRTGQTVW
jgi:hypothetical protein